MLRTSDATDAVSCEFRFSFHENPDLFLHTGSAAASLNVRFQFIIEHGAFIFSHYVTETGEADSLH